MLSTFPGSHCSGLFRLNEYEQGPAVYCYHELLWTAQQAASHPAKRHFLHFAPKHSLEAIFNPLPSSHAGSLLLKLGPAAVGPSLAHCCWAKLDYIGGLPTADAGERDHHLRIKRTE